MRATDAEVERLRSIIETDRTLFFEAIRRCTNTLAGCQWLCGPGRGSYAYADARYQAEFAAAWRAIMAELDRVRAAAQDLRDRLPTNEAVQQARLPAYAALHAAVEHIEVAR